MRKKKQPSLSALETKLDEIFSIYIRRRDADEGGTVECVTCGKLMHFSGDGAQAGHFVKRQHRATRYDERNVNVQCTRCNHFLGGAEAEHGAHIIRKYGLEVHGELLSLKHQIKKFTRDELHQKIEHYKQKVRELDERDRNPRREEGPQEGKSETGLAEVAQIP